MKKKAKKNTGAATTTTIDSLPDEIWLKILEIGVKTRTLTPKDICFFSISCKYFNQLSNEETLWLNFLTLNFRGYHNYNLESSNRNLFKYLYLRFKRLMHEYEIIKEPIMEVLETESLAVLDRFYEFFAEKLESLEKRMDIFKELASMVHGITDREGKNYLSFVLNEDTSPLKPVQQEAS